MCGFLGKKSVDPWIARLVSLKRGRGLALTLCSLRAFLGYANTGLTKESAVKCLRNGRLMTPT